MLSRWISGFLAVLLCCAGGFLLLAVLAGLSHHASIPSLLSVPGGFLYGSFLWGAFYIPIYLFLCGILAALPDFRRDWLAILTLSILPFLTASLLFLLLATGGSTPLQAFFVSALGAKGGAIVLFLLLILEAVLIYRVWLGMKGTQPDDEAAEEDASGAEAPAAQSATDGSAQSPSGSEERHAPSGPGGRRLVTAASGGRLERLVTSLGERWVAEEGGVPHPGERAPSAGRAAQAFDLPFAGDDPFPVPPPIGSLRSAEAFAELSEIQNGHASATSEPASPLLAGSRARATDETERTGEIGELEPPPKLSALARPEPVIVFRNGSFRSDPGELDEAETTEEEQDPDAEEEVLLYEEPRDGAAEEEGQPPEAIPLGAAAAAPLGSGSRAPARRSGRYVVPLGELLNDYPDGEYWVIDEDTERAAEILKRTLEEFNIQAEVTGIRKGPVITMYEILPAPGVKLSKIVNLADNIALRLAASRVRIVAPIPGKHAVGIEVPNKHRAIVSFKEMIASEDFAKSKMEIPVILGKDITGGAQTVDLVQTPHLLIAGATGSGKSVCVNSIICSILYTRRPEEVRLILIDPKIVELKLYNEIPHLLTPVITESKRAFQALQYCIYEMERRYSLLDTMGVRDIRSYNRRVRDRKIATTQLPYIVVVIDEFADLMATTGKELESTLARLAAMSRAVGIHLVIATQRPSIDVITGLIKANIPSRIAFMVASKFDSRIIIDAVGAEMLLGRGDMLFTSAWDPFPLRIQGAYLSEEEVERVTDHVRTLGEPDYIDDEIFVNDEEEFSLMNDDGSDPMYDAALDIVVAEGKASASYLQRRLKIGYNRAARIVEEFEERGIVGPQQGSKPREVIHVPDRHRE